MDAPSETEPEPVFYRNTWENICHFRIPAETDRGLAFHRHPLVTPHGHHDPPNYHVPWGRTGGSWFHHDSTLGGDRCTIKQLTPHQILLLRRESDSPPQPDSANFLRQFWTRPANDTTKQLKKRLTFRVRGLKADEFPVLLIGSQPLYHRPDDLAPNYDLVSLSRNKEGRYNEL